MEPHNVNTANKFAEGNFQQNIYKVKELFSFPNNTDIIFRNIYSKAIEKSGVLIFIKEAVDLKEVEQFLIQPLIEKQLKIDDQSVDDILDTLLIKSNIKGIDNFDDLEASVISGSSVLMIEGFDKAFCFDVTNFKYRDVEQTKIENVIKGPKEAFVESLVANKSLIRKRIRSANLMDESIAIGQVSSAQFSMFYLKNIANDELVNRVKEKIAEIKTDGIVSIAQLEQYLEERPYSLVPTVLYTERPDRAAAFLLEGHIVLIGDSEACLVLPVTFWSFFHTAEDYYQRWAYSNFIRLLRIIAFFVTLLLPAIYISATNYHVGMVPTDLLMSIKASRELVPLPAIIELLLMELTFEFIREAGSRNPTALGTTIGIIGALILGQAGIQAGVISPILIMVVALTGLASYVITEYSLTYMIRIGRFIFLIAAVIYGFLGVSVLLAIAVSYLVTIKSFGVPYLAPLVPFYPSSKDTVFKPPIWKQWLRPFYLNPKDKIR